jgi:hypothetical protein
MVGNVFSANITDKSVAFPSVTYTLNADGSGNREDPGADIVNDFNNQVYDPGMIKLNPGAYCCWTSFDAPSNITFNPGLDVIENGGMTINPARRSPRRRRAGQWPPRWRGRFRTLCR